MSTQIPALSDIKKTVKRSMNKFEWNQDLDKFLMTSVVRNYFNFEVVSLEINRECKRYGFDFGISNIFTMEKCRMRWSYLHLQRKLGKTITYKSSPYASASEGEKDKENNSGKSNENKISGDIEGSRIAKLINAVKPAPTQTEPSKNAQQVEVYEAPLVDAKAMFESKSYNSVTEKKEAKSFADIEKNMWKNNLKSGERKNRDWLDTSNEDFGDAVSKDISGQDFNPSNFNIFRDSLRVVSEQMQTTLNMHLPELNLKEVSESESDNDEEVLPLDFNTAMLHGENRIVIQAKPLTFKEGDDIEIKKADFSSLQAFLESARKDPFKEDEGAVMIDPDINIREKLENIMLPCDEERRINNNFNAPISTRNPGEPRKKSGPVNTKSYESDAGTASEAENSTKPIEPSNQNLPKVNPNFPENSKYQQRNHQRYKEGIVSEIIEDKQKEADQNKEENRFDALDDLDKIAGEQPIAAKPENEEEISDFAPISPFADVPSQEEEKVQKAEEKKNVFAKSVEIVSSASESEESGAESRAKRLQKLAELKGEKKKVQFYKGVPVGSDHETIPKRVIRDPNASPDRMSEGSASDDFNEQRKNMRSKLNIESKTNMSPIKTRDQPDPKKTRDFEEDSEESETEEAFQARIAEEQRQQASMMMKKKQDAIARQRREAQVIDQKVRDEETAQRQKEKDELMAKVKKQDEERKRRKREEKEKKERYQREYIQRIEDERILRVEREEDEKKIKQEAENHKRQLQLIQEQKEMRKLEIEVEKQNENAWEAYGRPDVPCLFNKKASFTNELPQIPFNLEEKIQANTVEKDDLQLRRYKALMIPLDRHLNNKSICDLIQFFLTFSSMQQVKDKNNSAAEFQPCFDYKCISMQIGVTKAPLNTPSLTSVQSEQDVNSHLNSIRILNILFDTKDEPKQKNKIFDEVLSDLKLSNFMKESQVEHIYKNYRAFIENLVGKYERVGKLNQFQLFKINKVSKNGEVTFNQESQLPSSASEMNLGHIAFFSRYTKQDDVAPMSSKESWDLFRRSPSFWAFNPNKPGYTSLQNEKKHSFKVKNRKNQYDLEIATVIFKDISFDVQDDQICRQSNSIDYFLREALTKQALDICGARMIYVDEQVRRDYSAVYGEELKQEDGTPVLALSVRGHEAEQKAASILGSNQPGMARTKKERSVRAFFGRSTEQNCAIHSFNARETLDLHFWFGGRVTEGEMKMGTERDCSERVNQTETIVPGHIEKNIMLISPLISASILPKIMQRLTSIGISVFEIQKINLENLHYAAGEVGKLRTEVKKEFRGKTVCSKVGFILKIARENLSNHFLSHQKDFQRDLDSLMEQYNLNELIQILESPEEYKKVNSILKKSVLKTNYNYNIQAAKHDAGNDSDDPEQYNFLKLWNNAPVVSSGLNKKSNIKPIKKLVDQREKNEKFKIGTSLCFIKISSMRKQMVGNTMHAILNMIGAELLGVKIVKANKDLFTREVPTSVKSLVKSVAYKFHGDSTELKLRKKMKDFTCLMLVIRGANLEGEIDKVYDRERLRFRQEVVPGFEDQLATPYVLFVTNDQSKQVMIDFALETKYVKMYQDCNQSFDFLNSSLDFHMKMKTQIVKRDDGEIDAALFQEIKKSEDLLDQSKGESTSAVVVLKPNQPFSVLLKSLKQVIGINAQGSSHKDEGFIGISKIQYIQEYSYTQVDLLFEHDILFDDVLSETQKERFKTRFSDMFEGKRVMQFVVHGQSAIQKLRLIFGPRDPKNSIKQESLRSYYGYDRFDNAFFVSETVEESIIEQEVLFAIHKELEEEQIDSTQDSEQQDADKISQILTTKKEIATILISPTLVKSNEFVYIIEDFFQAKFTICGIKMKTFNRDDLADHFSNTIPRVHNLDVLEIEFKKGDAVILLVEKEKAVEEASKLIGNVSIKVGNDFIKDKRKEDGPKTFQYKNQFTEDTLVSEYGSFIFNFKDTERNIELAKKEFCSFMKARKE